MELSADSVADAVLWVIGASLQFSGSLGDCHALTPRPPTSKREPSCFPQKKASGPKHRPKKKGNRALGVSPVAASVDHPRQLVAQERRARSLDSGVQLPAFLAETIAGS